MNSPKDYLTDRIVEKIDRYSHDMQNIRHKIDDILEDTDAEKEHTDNILSLLTSEVERTLDIVEKEWVFKLKAWTKSDWYEFRKALSELKGGEK